MAILSIGDHVRLRYTRFSITTYVPEYNEFICTYKGGSYGKYPSSFEFRIPAMVFDVDPFFIYERPSQRLFFDADTNEWGHVKLGGKMHAIHIPDTFDESGIYYVAPVNGYGTEQKLRQPISSFTDFSQETLHIADRIPQTNQDGDLFTGQDYEGIQVHGKIIRMYTTDPTGRVKEYVQTLDKTHLIDAYALAVYVVFVTANYVWVTLQTKHLKKV